MGRDGVQYELGEVRKAELEKNIKAALDYHEKIFGVKLTPADVYAILCRDLEKNQDRQFMQRVGSVSEADVLYFASEHSLSTAAVEARAGKTGDSVGDEVDAETKARVEADLEQSKVLKDGGSNESNQLVESREGGSDSRPAQSNGAKFGGAKAGKQGKGGEAKDLFA